MEGQSFYFAVNKKTEKLLDPYSIKKISWIKLGYLKGIFSRLNINKDEYNIYEVNIINGIPILNSNIIKL